MTAHPNTVAAGGTTGVGVLTVWLLGHFGVDLTAEVAVVLAGGATAAVLFVGRNGIKGALRRVWRGPAE